MKLTKPQLAELDEQIKKGPQPTYGSSRARVQNNLVRLGLSEFLNAAGEVTTPKAFFAWTNGIGDRCAVTDAGRKAFKEARR